MKVAGVVGSVWSKTKNTRAGDKTIWYADVEGEHINMGFKPVAEAGETVSWDVEEKYGELQIVRAGVGGKPKPVSSRPSAPAKGGWGKKSGSFPVEATDSQVSIIRQSSLNRAVDTAKMMLEHGILPVSGEEELVDTILSLAYTYTDFGTGQREVKLAKEEAVKRASMEAING